MENFLYFLKPPNKAMNSQARITQYMQQQRQSTRPQIAEAMGLSLVSTNAAVATLVKKGVMIAGETQPSGGGRPVQLYHFNPRHAAVALFTAEPETHCTRLHFELLDLYGQKIEEMQARFVQLHAESLDEWLDAITRHHKLQRICLPPGLGSLVAEHLHQRYNCAVQELYTAESLAGRQEETLTLLLQQGQAPQGAMRRHGSTTPCPLLHLLPLPHDWETLDYSDHTLVEEMLARLLQLLTCTLTPRRICLYADFWNDRLISRINFNLSTKLRSLSTSPHLHYAAITQEKISGHLRQAAVR